MIAEWTAYVCAAVITYTGCKWLFSIGDEEIDAVYQ